MGFLGFSVFLGFFRGFSGFLGPFGGSGLVPMASWSSWHHFGTASCSKLCFEGQIRPSYFRKTDFQKYKGRISPSFHHFEQSLIENWCQDHQEVIRTSFAPKTMIFWITKPVIEWWLISKNWNSLWERYYTTTCWHEWSISLIHF